MTPKEYFEGRWPTPFGVWDSPQQSAIEVTMGTVFGTLKWKTRMTKVAYWPVVDLLRPSTGLARGWLFIDDDTDLAGVL